jgi:hypothetical protein
MSKPGSSACPAIAVTAARTGRADEHFENPAAGPVGSIGSSCRSNHGYRASVGAWLCATIHSDATTTSPIAVAHLRSSAPTNAAACSRAGGSGGESVPITITIPITIPYAGKPVAYRLA